MLHTHSGTTVCFKPKIIWTTQDPNGGSLFSPPEWRKREAFIPRHLNPGVFVCLFVCFKEKEVLEIVGRAPSQSCWALSLFGNTKEVPERSKEVPVSSAWKKPCLTHRWLFELKWGVASLQLQFHICKRGWGGNLHKRKHSKKKTVRVALEILDKLPKIYNS